MTAQASVPPGQRAAHPNARVIERLYTAIQNADPKAIAACYAEDAYFEDIAFQLRGRKRILEMWELVCHAAPKVCFDPASISADDRKGHGRWRAKYIYGKTATAPGRPVDNTLTSEFAFRDGLIVDHRDGCDAMAWARMAFPFPKSLIAGSIPPLRRYIAAQRLKEFTEKSKQ
jgi:ketosteroid isomerase-like protein